MVRRVVRLMMSLLAKRKENNTGVYLISMTGANTGMQRVVLLLDLPVAVKNQLVLIDIFFRFVPVLRIW